MTDLDSPNALWKAISALTTGITALLVWTGIRQVKRIDAIEADESCDHTERRLSSEFAEHTRSTAKQIEGIRQELTHSVTRLHDKLDQTSRDWSKRQDEQTNRIIEIIKESKHG